MIALVVIPTYLWEGENDMAKRKRRISLLLAAALLISLALPLTVQAGGVQPEPSIDCKNSSSISGDPDVPRAEITEPLSDGTIAFVDKLFYADATVVGGSDVESLTWSVSDPNGNVVERADVECLEGLEDPQSRWGFFRFLPVQEDAGKTLLLSVWPTGHPEAASMDSVSFHVAEKPTVQIHASPASVEAGEEVTVTATITDYPIGYGDGIINCTWNWVCPGWVDADLPDEMAHQTLSATSGQPVTSTITFTVPTAAQLSASGKAVEGIDVSCYLTFRRDFFAEIEPNADQTAEITVPLQTPMSGTIDMSIGRRPFLIAPGEDMILSANISAAPAGSELVWSVTGEYPDAVALDPPTHAFSAGETYASAETVLKTSPDIPYDAQQYISAKLVKDGATLAESEESPVYYEHKLKLTVDPPAPKYGDLVTVLVAPSPGAELADWNCELYVDVGQDWESVLVATNEVCDKENRIVFRMPTARLPLTVDVWGTVRVDGQQKEATAWTIITPSGVQPDGPSGEPSTEPSAEPSGAVSEEPSSEPSAVPSGAPSAEPSGTASAAPSGGPSSTASLVPSSQPSATTPVSPIEPNPDGPLPDLEVAENPDGTGSVLLGVPIGTAAKPVTVTDLLKSISVPTNANAAVLSADGEVLADDASVGTGCFVEVRSADQAIMTIAVVVRGDVLGTGVLNITQVVRLARAINGEAPLEGVYLEAALLTGGSNVNIADLVTLAKMLLDPPAVRVNGKLTETSN